MSAIMHTHRNKERGIALITGLIILVLLTLIGVTAARSTLLQERMAGNLRDQNVAFQSAEAALRWGEGYLNGASLSSFVADTSTTVLSKTPTGLYQATMSPTLERWQQGVWDDAGSVAYPRTPDNLGAAIDAPEGAAETPRFIIEDLSTSIKCTTANTVSCTTTPVNLQPGGSLKLGAVEETGVYRITARGVGTSANTIVFLQSYYFR